MILQQYLQQAISAHRNTSFSPERRGKQLIEEYSRELENDLKELGHKNNYEEKYKRHFSNWLSAKSRCFSVMITGGANFDNRKHSKANQAEDNSYDKFRSWREGYFKAVNRVPRKTNLELLKEKQDKLEEILTEKEAYKNYNKLARKFKKDRTDESFEAAMKEFISVSENLGKDKDEIKRNVKHFGSYSNFSGNISISFSTAKLKKEIEELESRMKIAREFETRNYPELDLTVFIADDEYLCLENSEKPEKTITDLFNRSGFNWSPKNNRWQRKLTLNAIRKVDEIVVNLGKEII